MIFYKQTRLCRQSAAKAGGLCPPQTHVLDCQPMLPKTYTLNPIKKLMTHYINSLEKNKYMYTETRTLNTQATVSTYYNHAPSYQNLPIEMPSFTITLQLLTG